MSASPRVPTAAPAGLVLRPYGGEPDLPDIVRISNAEYEADGIEEHETVEGDRAHFASASEQFDARRDVVVAELEGRIVAVAGQDWIDTRDGELREYRLWGNVDPAHRRRGIGTALLADNERRARALASTHAVGRRRKAYSAFAGDGRPGASVLEAAGYEVARWFFEMVRPSLDGLADLPLPAGLELRPVTPDQHLGVWRANREAFRDHWGGADESEAAMHRFFDQPDADPSLWLIAWEGNEIAGGIINWISPEQNAALGTQRGWLQSVFTRRAWRRRGMARALIAKSLILLRERGMTSAGLGVDADNALGALGLYEEAGFVVSDRFNAWRKPMEAAAE